MRTERAAPAASPDRKNPKSARLSLACSPDTGLCSRPRSPASWRHRRSWGWPSAIGDCGACPMWSVNGLMHRCYRLDPTLAAI